MKFVNNISALTHRECIGFIHKAGISGEGCACVRVCLSEEERGYSYDVTRGEDDFTEIQTPP